MEEKVIELYGLDKETASKLRKEADSCRKSFTIKTSDSFGREVVGMFVRTLGNFSQQDLAEFKKLLERVGKKESVF